MNYYCDLQSHFLFLKKVRLIPDVDHTHWWAFLIHYKRFVQLPRPCWHIHLLRIAILLTGATLDETQQLEVNRETVPPSYIVPGYSFLFLAANPRDGF